MAGMGRTGPATSCKGSPILRGGPHRPGVSLRNKVCWESPRPGACPCGGTRSALGQGIPIGGGREGWSGTPTAAGGRMRALMEEEGHGVTAPPGHHPDSPPRLCWPLPSSHRTSWG